MVEPGTEMGTEMGTEPGVETVDPVPGALDGGSHRARRSACRRTGWTGRSLGFSAGAARYSIDTPAAWSNGGSPNQTSAPGLSGGSNVRVSVPPSTLDVMPAPTASPLNVASFAVWVIT